MKLLTVAIPSYNSEAYLHKAVDSALIGGDAVEILIVNDGSKDATASIANEYEARYPTIVRAIHQENGGHGDAVLTGIKHAAGLFFKVLDSDDWLDEKAFPVMLALLEQLSQEHNAVDAVISNYIYDKVNAKRKRVIGYANALPQNCIFSWDDVKHFRVGQYILMHSVIYNTAMLRRSGLVLPKHTFYVDNLYVYVPLQYVERMYYANINLYHYYIGREDQSVQESIMIQRIDQQLLVNKMMSEAVDLSRVRNKTRKKYMTNYLEIITTISCVLLVKAGDGVDGIKHNDLWKYLKRTNPMAYRHMRYRPLGLVCHMPGRLGQRTVKRGYSLSKKYFGFN